MSRKRWAILSACVAMLLGGSAACLAASIMEADFIWAAVENGSVIPYTEYFVTGNCWVTRGTNEFIYISASGTGYSEPGADDAIEMQVGTSGPWIRLTEIFNYSHTDITCYVPVGTSYLRFRAWDNNDQTYSATALYVLRIADTGLANPGSQEDLADTREPINTMSGDLHFEESDLLVPCPGVPLVFDRRYGSLDAQGGALGPGWTHSYEWRLSDTNSVMDGLTLNTWKVLHTPEGQEYSFRLSGTNTYDPLVEPFWHLSYTNSRYEVRLPGGTVYAFNTNGLLEQIADLWNNTVTLSYSNACLTRASHTNGQYLAFTWAANRITRVSTPSTNLYLALAYDSQSRLTNATRWGAGQKAACTYAYDTWLTQRVDAAGIPFRYTYTNDGRGIGVQVQTNYYRHTVDYVAAGTTTVAYVMGSSTQHWKYVFNPGTRKLSSVYGPMGTPAATNIVTDYLYSSDLGLLFHAEHHENTNRYFPSRSFDAIGQMTYMKRHYQSTALDCRRYTWNTNLHLVTSSSDSLGHKVGFDYTNGSVSRIRMYISTNASYDLLLGRAANGLITGVTNANGHWVRTFYDAYGFPTSSVPQAGPTATYECTQMGYLSKISFPGRESDENGNNIPREVAFDRDGFGRATKITYLTTNSLYEYFHYDPLGNITNHIDTGGRSTKFSWLPTRELSAVTRQFGTSNLTTSLVYDNQFNTLRITDAKGRAVESYALDPQGRTVAITNLEGQGMAVSFSMLDCVASVTRFDGTAVANEYNTDGLLTRQAFPGLVEAFGYYSNRMLRTASNATCTVSNGYDFADRRTGVQITRLVTPSLSVSYGYDPVGNCTNLSGVAGAYSWTHDEAERVSSISATRSGLSPLGFNVTYDETNGLVSYMTCTNTGVGVTYDWDDWDRLTKVTWRDASNAVIRSFSYGLNSAGMVTDCQFASGENHHYSYDDLDRLTGETQTDSLGQPFFSEAIGYDEVGNRTSKTRDGITVSYTTPANHNRLSGWSVTQTNLSGQMDVLGYADEDISANSHWGQLWVSNSTIKVTPSVGSSNFWVYDMGFGLGTQQVVAAIRDAAGNTAFITNQVFLSVVTNGAYLYSAAGCVTNISYSGVSYSMTAGLTWDSRYQLTEVKTNGVSAERNGYDALGRRVWCWDTSTGSGQACTNYFLWDGANLTAEVDATGGLRRAYVYAALDMPLAMTVYTGATAQTYFYITDRMGTVHAVTDSTGTNIVEQYRFDAWGRVLGVYDGQGTPLTTSAIGNRFLWQGREYSWNTGFYYFRARWFDPVTGRWLSNDPIGISGGLNQYVFCGNSPVNFRDPMGLCEDDGYGDIALQAWLDFQAGLMDFAVSQFDSMRGAGNAPGFMTAWQTTLLQNGVDWAVGPGSGMLMGRSAQRSGASYWTGQGTGLVMSMLCMAQAGGAGQRGIGGRGWRGDARWREAVRSVQRGGDVSLPVTATQQEAVDLLREAGATIRRIEPGHLGGVSSHTYSHINFVTAEGVKGALRVIGL